MAAFCLVFVAGSGAGAGALLVGVGLGRNEDVVDVQLHAGEIPAVKKGLFSFLNFFQILVLGKILVVEIRFFDRKREKWSEREIKVERGTNGEREREIKIEQETNGEMGEK